MIVCVVELTQYRKVAVKWQLPFFICQLTVNFRDVYRIMKFIYGCFIMSSLI